LETAYRHLPFVISGTIFSILIFSSLVFAFWRFLLVDRRQPEQATFEKACCHLPWSWDYQKGAASEFEQP
jgi:hypothetical protein